MASIGQVIDGKYEILTLIGTGGMSKVYLARDRRLNKQWAVKEIQKRARDKNNEIVVQSAIAEANMIKQLDHPAIVRIVDIIDNQDVIYIIEDYIEGETLSTILEDNGAQPQELVIEWAMQICEALEYLHTRKPAIIYRDMKPSNVMLRPDGNIKIIDFGIAREYKEQSLADTVSLGTKGYAAPEQFGGKGQTDARTDVYCLGVTLYHLVTGHSPCDPPYEIYPIRHWNPQLDPGLEAIIEKCTQLNPNDRYQSCAELLYALQHYRENGAAYRAKQKRKLKSFIAVLAAAFVCAAVGVTGLMMRTHLNDEDYTLTLRRAELSTNAEEKVQYYLKAIELKPENLEPYLEMIDTFKSDINEVELPFSVEEEKILRDAVIKNKALLQEQEDYGKLAFEIGKLYWYYYDYSASEKTNNKNTRMDAAVPWFKEAAESAVLSAQERDMASVYRDIGTFMNKIETASQEGDDNKLYKDFWDNLSDLAEMLADSKDDPEIVKLEAYKLVVHSIENYAYKFEKNGVTYSVCQELFERVESATGAVAADTEVTERLKDEIVSRLQQTQDKINTVYRDEIAG